MKANRPCQSCLPGCRGLCSNYRPPSVNASGPSATVDMAMIRVSSTNTINPYIIGKSTRQPTYLCGSLSCLAEVASRPQWRTNRDIDVPLRQHSVCQFVDIASYHHLLFEAPDSRCKPLALSSAISHAGDWLNVVP